MGNPRIFEKKEKIKIPRMGIFILRFYNFWVINITIATLAQR